MSSSNVSTLSMRIVTYLIEYLDEFKFIFETILDYESGDQMGTFYAKKPPWKISCLGTFKILPYLKLFETSKLLFMHSIVYNSAQLHWKISGQQT
jgi:hypothetical protein